MCLYPLHPPPPRPAPQGEAGECQGPAAEGQEAEGPSDPGGGREEAVRAVQGPGDDTHLHLHHTWE